MASMTKPINRPLVIDSKKTEQFIRDFNKNRVSDEFVNSCKRVAQLFKKDKNNV